MFNIVTVSKNGHKICRFQSDQSETYHGNAFIACDMLHRMGYDVTPNQFKMDWMMSTESVSKSKHSTLKYRRSKVNQKYRNGSSIAYDDVRKLSPSEAKLVFKHALKTQGGRTRASMYLGFKTYSTFLGWLKMNNLEHVYY
ncbi:MAG: hypothetical protein ACO20M_06000 [Methylophilaceae bacterium]